MDFKSLLKSLDQLNEGVTTTKTGKIHTAEPGGYGRKDDEDEEGNKVKKDTAPKGRGRPKKNADSETGDVKKYDATGLTDLFGIKKPNGVVGKRSVKHSLKDWIEAVDEQNMIAEAGLQPPAPGKNFDSQTGKALPGRALNAVRAKSQYNSGALGQVRQNMANRQQGQQVGEDELEEAGLAVQPIPAPKQASGQNFMIKDPANPTASAITTSDPAVVKAAKDGTLSMQKPGASSSATPATGAGSQVGAMQEGELDEKIEGGVKLNPEKKGMFDGKSKSELMSQYNKLKASGPHKKGSPENTKMHELAFAIRAKSGWGKVKEAEMDEAAKWRDPKYKGQLFTQKKGDSDDYDSISYGYDTKERPKKDPGQKRSTFDRDTVWTDPLEKGYRMSADNSITTTGKRKGLPSRDQITSLKRSIKDVLGQHGKSNLPEAEAPQHYAQSSPMSNGGRSDTFLESADKKKMPSIAHIKKMCKDGKSVAEICKMHPDCDHKELKQMVADCKKKMIKESMNHKLKAAHHAGKSHALSKQAYNCHYDDMDECSCYHEGYKEGLDECYGQVPIMGRTRVGEMGPGAEVDNMASFGSHTPELDEMDKTAYMKQQAIKTPGDTFKAFGQTMHDKDVLENSLAFEALDSKLNALLSEGLTVSISKGQQGSPDSVSVNAQDGEADMLLNIIKQAGLGVFGGEEEAMVDTPNGSHEVGGIEVVDDHDGMMSLMKRLSGQDMSADSHDYEDEEAHDHEETCNECNMPMESCGCDHGDKEMVDEVESEDQMAYKVAEDEMDEGAQNPPDNSSANSTNATQGNDAANTALAIADKDGMAESEMDESEECPTCHHKECECDEEKVEESFTFESLYKKLAWLSEESTSEKDDKAEKAAKKVAKDIEYDEGHKGKDDDKAEKAGKKVKKDIEYDDKKDKKLDEWANDAGPGKSVSDTTFEQDIEFMTKIISGGLNKPKSTGQTTIPVIAGQGKRTGVSESKMLNESVSDWKKLAGI